MQIQILGMGCPTCRRMEIEVRQIIQKLRLDAAVSRVEDIELFLNLRVTALPGLVVDGRLVACGYSGRDNLERLLKELDPCSNELTMEPSGG